MNCLLKKVSFGLLMAFSVPLLGTTFFEPDPDFVDATGNLVSFDRLQDAIVELVNEYREYSFPLFVGEDDTDVPFLINAYVRTLADLIGIDALELFRKELNLPDWRNLAQGTFMGLVSESANNVVHYLLEHGFRVNEPSELLREAINAHNPALVRLFLKMGANPFQANDFGETPFALARSLEEQAIENNEPHENETLIRNILEWHGVNKFRRSGRRDR